MTAPAGYGKTTLLSQWAEDDPRPFAWVSIDEGDNDPKLLLAYLAEALNGIEAIDERVFDALASPAASVGGSLIPRVGAAFSVMTSPMVLVLDDVHHLHDPDSRTALAVLADHVPDGSRLALAGRAPPPLPVARLRAEGRVQDVDPADLVLTEDESAGLLREAGAAVGAQEMAALHQRTEGWAAGLYLAALAVRPGGPADSARSFGGSDLFVSDYVESEFLTGISERHRDFLTRTAVLERLSGAICDAVLEVAGSAVVLRELARSNLLLVPLDHRGLWYRHHRLFRDVLLAELERREPGVSTTLQRRAAAWCLDNDQPEAALEYSMAAGDVDTAAGLVQLLGPAAYTQGRTATRERWMRWLADRGGIQGRPQLAVQAAFVAGHTGRAAEVERWSDEVDHWQSTGQDDDPTVAFWTVALRAQLCRQGVEQMRADADDFARRVVSDHSWSAHALSMRLQAALRQGVAHLLCGDPGGAEAFFERASSTEEVGAPDIRAWALCERSLLAVTRDDWSQAESFADEARATLHQAQLDDGYIAPLVCAVQARVAAHLGNADAAWQQLVDAQQTRHLLTYALPDLAVQARLELARVHLALGDVAGAGTLVREIDDVLRVRPGLGILVGEADELRSQLAKRRGSDAVGASSLTGAELRLLPYLRTHLTSERIADRLFVSSWTVKTQVKSIYRKLGVSSRDDAVQKATAIGLLGI